MKAFTKLLSILLVVAMCLGLMVVTASAEEVQETVESGLLVVNSSAAPGVPESAENAEEAGAAQVSEGNAVAKIKLSEEETLFFASLADAFAEAQEGQLVVLTRDLTVTKSVTVPKGVAFSLNGKTLIIVTHRRAALAICDYTLHIAGGEMTLCDKDGHPSSV